MRTMARKVWIVTEMLLLFVAGPALLAKLVYERHIPLFMILPIVLVGLIALLLLPGQTGGTWRADLVRLPGQAHRIFHSGLVRALRRRAHAVRP